MGSLYLLIASGGSSVTNTKSIEKPLDHSDCAHHDDVDNDRRPPLQARPGAHHSSGSHNAQNIDSDVEIVHAENLISPRRAMSTPTDLPTPDHDHTDAADKGNRLKVARMLTNVGKKLGTANYNWYDDSQFKRGKAVDFPEVPGERQRNPDLQQIKEHYSQTVTPGLRRQRSRAGSFTGSERSRLSIEGGPSTPREPPSPQSPRESSTWPVQADASTESRPQLYRPTNTLEVPSPAYHSHIRANPPSSSSSIPVIQVVNDQASPTIVISPDPAVSLPAETSAASSPFPEASSSTTPSLKSSEPSPNLPP